MLKQLSLAFLFGVMLVPAIPATADTTPTEAVRTSVNAILDILKDEQLDRQSKRDRMRSIIHDRFDFRAMSQRTLATNWKKASKEEQQQFISLFGELIQNSYIGKVELYTNETVEFPNEKLKGKKAVVDTLIITSSTEIPVNYKLYLKQEQWRVYDVIIEGVSLISNYRSSYQEIVKKEGFSGLLARMEAKIKELESQPAAGKQPA